MKSIVCGFLLFVLLTSAVGVTAATDAQYPSSTVEFQDPEGKYTITFTFPDKDNTPYKYGVGYVEGIGHETCNISHGGPYDVVNIVVADTLARYAWVNIDIRGVDVTDWAIIGRRSVSDRFLVKAKGNTSNWCKVRVCPIKCIDGICDYPSRLYYLYIDGHEGEVIVNFFLTPQKEIEKTAQKEIEKIILKASKDGYASVKQEIENAENFGSIEISGKVTDKSTGEPIEGAKVEIVKGAGPASTTTDAAGSYTITVIIPDGSGSDTREDVNFELPPAEYIITAETFTAEIQQAIEDNNGTVLETFDVPDGGAVLILVNVSKEEKVEAFLENVGAVSGVKYIDPNRVRKVSYVPNDPWYPLQWGPRRIQAGGLPNPSAWDWEQGNKNVTIAILDTGVDYNHRDLKPNYKIGGYDWVNDDNDPMDDDGHGTHVAGIAAAVIDNNNDTAGMAQCNIVSEKMLNGGVFDEVKAIYGASMQNADVLSMSFGGFGYIKAEEAACHSAWLKGCILVAASGNERGPWVREDVEDIPAVYPASYEDVIAVGAIDQNDNLWVGSNWGPGQELVAPGVDILSTRVGGGTTYMTGTSMAAPHVSGVVALLKSHAKQFPPEPLTIEPWYHLNNKQIRKILQLTAEDLGPPGWDPRFGYGLVTAKSTFRCVNVSGNVLEEVLFAPIRNVEIRLTSIEGPPGVYSTNENTTFARITPEGDYYVQVPPGVYSICAMAYGYIPSRGLGGERMELPAFDLTGQLTTEHQNLRLLRLPCTVFGNVTDNITELPINKAHVSLDGPPHIYPPHPNVKIKTETNASGKYRFILTFGVHPGGLYNISVSKSGYLTKTQNFTLNWSNVITDYYKCPLSPLDYNPPIVNFSLPPVPSELPDLTLARDGIQIIFNDNIATISATIHNIGTADASNIVVQFFDGDPDAGGTQIGTDRKITGIAHDSSGTVQVTWTAIPGTHDIFVRVDPYNTIQEAKEDNNQAYKQITIGGAKTIYVDDDFTDDPANHRWDTIQEGINDANDGDTVLVYNGTYTENVTLNKTLTLIGDGMPKIDAHGSGDAIKITADNCTVKGFNCVNAQPSPYAGIHVKSNNNVIVENTCKDNDVGIYLSGTSNEVRNNIADYNDHHGINLLWLSSENIIANNTARNNGNNGIFLTISDNNSITDNVAANNNNSGIYLSFSDNNEIRNNCANDNHNDSIELAFSDENIVANNTAKNNGDNGIYLAFSHGNRITDNAASSNVNDGISLSVSKANNIAHNTAKDNGNKGLLLSSSSSNNTIYLNNFVDNLDNAFSFGSSFGSSNTTWHSPSTMTYTYSGNTYTNYLGNYWSDYKGSDTDGDGIGDSSYSIDGDEDICPLMKPWENYFALQVNWPPLNPTLIPECKVQITSDPSDTDRPSIVYANGFYYVAYQSIEKSHGIDIKKFDSLWKFKKKVEVVSGSAYYDSPSLAFANNKLYVAYISNAEGANKNDYDVIVKEYNPNSFACTSGEKYLTTLQSCQDLPALYYKDGYFYLAYQSWETGNGDIYIKKFDSNWNPLKQVRVTSKSSLQDGPSITYANGYFYVAYYSMETDNRDIFVKRLNSNLNLDVFKKQITFETSRQTYPSIAFVNNQFALAYASSETGTWGIYMKRYDKNWNYIGKTKVIDDNSAHERRPSIIYAQNDFWIAYVRYLEESDNWYTFVIIPGCE